MKNLFNKLNKVEEPEDLDTGYDSDYYGGAYSRDRDEKNGASAQGANTYEERDARASRPGSYSDTYEPRRASDTAPRDSYDRYDRYDRAERYDRPSDGYRVYGEDTAAQYSRVAERQAPASRPENRGTLYITPEEYAECRSEIVTGLMGGHVIVVNVRYLDRGDLLRLFDYVMGAAHALEAEMSRINATNILICPKGVEIDEEELELDDEELDEEYTDEDYNDEEYDDYDEEYDEDYELNDYDQEDDDGSYDAYQQ